MPPPPFFPVVLRIGRVNFSPPNKTRLKPSIVNIFAWLDSTINIEQYSNVFILDGVIKF